MGGGSNEGSRDNAVRVEDVSTKITNCLDIGCKDKYDIVPSNSLELELELD